MKEAMVYTALAVILICLGVALSIFLLGSFNLEFQPSLLGF